MPVVITIEGQDFIGGPDCHRPYHVISGTVHCANPYTPGGELFGAAELEAAIQALLGRTDITVSNLLSLQLGDCDDEDTFFLHNGVRLLAYEYPGAAIGGGAAGALPTQSWSDALVVAAHTVAIPGTGNFVPLAVNVTASGAATGPYGIIHGAPAAASTAQLDIGAQEINFLAADAVTECRLLLLDRGLSTVNPTVTDDGTPVEYGAVNISGIECKFLAVVTR